MDEGSLTFENLRYESECIRETSRTLEVIIILPNLVVVVLYSIVNAIAVATLQPRLVVVVVPSTQITCLHPPLAVPSRRWNLGRRRAGFNKRLPVDRDRRAVRDASTRFSLYRSRKPVYLLPQLSHLPGKHAAAIKYVPNVRVACVCVRTQLCRFERVSHTPHRHLFYRFICFTRTTTYPACVYVTMIQVRTLLTHLTETRLGGTHTIRRGYTNY